MLGLQKASEATKALAPKVARLGPLEPHGQALLGEALLLAGEGEAALVPLRRAFALDALGPVGSRAAALEADALLAAGHPGEASETAARLLLAGGHLLAEQRASLTYVRSQAMAQLALSPGALDATRRDAAAAARALWLRFPDHPHADAARLEEEKLAKLPPATGRELLQRTNKLLFAGQPAAAVETAREALPALDDDDAPEGQLLLARALAAAGQRAHATQPLAVAWANGGARTAPAAGLLLARDRARHGRVREAISLLDQLARKYPRSNEAPEAELVAAKLAEEAGSAAEAKRRLERLAAKNGGPRSLDARWALAWQSYRARKPDSAARFAKYAAEALDPAEKARGLYWAARAPPGKAGARAKALYAKVAALDPLGYYGALALRAAGKSSAEPPPFPPSAERVRREGVPAAPSALRDDEPEGDAARLHLGSELAALGLCNEATAELEVFVKSVHRDATSVLRALPLFERCHRFDRAVVLSQAVTTGGAGERRALLGHSYPAAYPELVARAASRTRLDPYLLLAVARRESLFRTDAHSAAGAVGLVQIRPKTASRIAAVLGRPPPDPESLADPRTALDFGSWYFSELLGAFGDPAIAAAAYNAGPQSVRKWLDGAAGRPLDEWVEEIPFRETRFYVRYVIGGWSAYRLLAGGSVPPLGGEVPAPRPGISF